MFSDAGSRLPWKSFHASTCTSVVASWPLPQFTLTLSDNVDAPSIVTAEAPVTAPKAIGAATTTASAPVSNPPRVHRERSAVDQREGAAVGTAGGSTMPSGVGSEICDTYPSSVAGGTRRLDAHAWTVGGPGINIETHPRMHPTNWH